MFLFLVHKIIQLTKIFSSLSATFFRELSNDLTFSCFYKNAAPKTAEPPKTGATQYTFLNRRTQLECHGIDDDKDAVGSAFLFGDTNNASRRYDAQKVTISDN